MKRKNIIAEFVVGISKEEYEAFDGLCEECWEDEMTEEIDTTEGTDEEFVPI